VFDIKNAEYTPGTNRYIFRYPEHWRLIQNQELSIGIRSIKLIRQPMYCSWDHLSLYFKTNSKGEAQTVIMDENFLIDSSDTVAQMNYTMFPKVENGIESHIQRNDEIKNDYKKGDFQLHYDVINHWLDLSIEGSPDWRYFRFWGGDDYEHDYFTQDFLDLVHVRSTTWEKTYNEMIGEWISVIKPGFFLDFARMLKLGEDFPDLVNFEDFKNEWSKEMSHIEIKFRRNSPTSTELNYRKPYFFRFKNVSNRSSSLMVKSGMVDLTNGQYLGYTNEQFNPMKYYKMHSQDQKFWIDLYDGVNNNPEELLANDRFIIEAVVLTNNKTI
jgi:hypothetical protein